MTPRGSFSWKSAKSIGIICLFVLHCTGSALCLFFHPVVNFDPFFLFESFHISISQNDLYEMGKLGFLMGQTSLIALWADRCPIRSYFRIPLALFLVMGFCWIASDPWNEYFYVRSYAVKISYSFLENSCYYGVNAISIILALSIIRLKRSIFGTTRKTGTSAPQAPFQFSVGSMLIWTAIVALFLGLGKLASNHPKFGVFDEYCLSTLEMGIFSVIYAYILIVAMLEFNFRWPRLIFVFLLLQSIAWLNSRILPSTGGCFRFPGCESFAAMAIANIQILTIFATILPLRSCGILGEDEEKERRNNSA